MSTRARARMRAEAEKQAKEFNAKHPIGTPVRYWPGAREGEGRLGTTRSEAWVLPSGEAVVLVKGCSGGIALSHVESTDGGGPVANRPKN